MTYCPESRKANMLYIVCLSAVGSEPPQLSVSEERHLAILTELPFVVPFEERVKVLPRFPIPKKKKKIVCNIVAEGVSPRLCQYDDAINYVSAFSKNVCYYLTSCF